MLFFKIILAVAVLSVGLFVFKDIYGDNAIFSGVKSGFSKSSEILSDNCFPTNYIGNKYIQIQTPSGFCRCLNDRKKAINEGKDLGKEISDKDFISMCVDVYYKKSFEIQCDKVNNMLHKAGKMSKMNCGCFSYKLNKYLSYSIARDGLGGEQGFFDLNGLANKNFESVQKNMSPSQTNKTPIYPVPRGVVTSCMK